MKQFYLLSLLLLTVATVSSAGVVGRHEGAHDLKISSDGKVAFSIGADGARVWDVEARHELTRLPAYAGTVIAVSADGRRILCHREHSDERQSLRLWWRPDGIWRAGTVVRSATIKKHLDAVFEGNELIILWRQNIERRSADGSLRETRKLKNLPHWPYADRAPTGALSRDSARMVLETEFEDRRHASIYDAKKGRLLKRIKLDTFNYYVDWEFSPDAKIVGAIVGEPVEMWNPADGPTPLRYLRYLWNLKTGKLVSYTTALSLTFLPDTGRTLLVEKDDDAPGKLELHDVDSEKHLSLPFARPWGNRALKVFRVSADGKELYALDEKGDIWLELPREASQQMLRTER